MIIVIIKGTDSHNLRQSSFHNTALLLFSLASVLAASFHHQLNKSRDHFQQPKSHKAATLPRGV